jgi:hypothetical protein
MELWNYHKNENPRRFSYKYAQTDQINDEDEQNLLSTHQWKSTRVSVCEIL